MNQRQYQFHIILGWRNHIQEAVKDLLNFRVQCLKLSNRQISKVQIQSFFELKQTCQTQAVRDK